MLFAKIHENIVGMGVIDDPPIQKNARYAIKVAHLLYLGSENEQSRNKAVTIVKGTRSQGSSSRSPQSIASQVTNNQDAQNSNTSGISQALGPMNNMLHQMSEMMKEIRNQQNNHALETEDLNISNNNNINRSKSFSSSRTHIDVANRFKTGPYL